MTKQMKNVMLCLLALVLVRCETRAQSNQWLLHGTAYDTTGHWPCFHKGKQAVLFNLRKQDPLVNGGRRCEISTPANDSPDVERWYYFSIMLSPQFVYDKHTETVAQWHERPDFNLGETWRQPPIAFRVKKGHWNLLIRWATQPVNTNATVSGKLQKDLGAHETGEWTDWIFHIKFSYKSDGLIEVWKNGTKVYTRNGPNYYNDQRGPFFKYGIYKPGWRNPSVNCDIESRTLLFSNVLIKDGNGNLVY